MKPGGRIRWLWLVTPLLMGIGEGSPAFAHNASRIDSAEATQHIYVHIVPPKDQDQINLQVAVETPEGEEQIGEASDLDVGVEATDLEVGVEAPVLSLQDEASTSQKLPLLPDAEPVVLELQVAPTPVETDTAEQVIKGQEASSMKANMGLLFFVFVLAIFLGFELISKVPSQLHTPLMSGSNAISGITIVGALIAAGHGDKNFTVLLGTLAVAFAMINVVGGYLVTDRMLAMFKHKDKGGQP